MDSRNITSHPLWPSVLQILQTLHKNGFQAVLVGGCVRDALLNLKFKDMDIATNATPEQIQPLFDRVEMIGQSFGVCAVVIDGQSFEVATFREDSKKSDGRHPESIRYTSLEKDVLRRDFTINALYYDPFKNTVIDLVGGQKDLLQKNLKAVGDPDVRFQEDYLRILRALRFAARLQFQIEPATLQSIHKNRDGLEQISWERVRGEFDQALGNLHRKDFLKQCAESGVLKSLFKDFDLSLGFRTSPVTPMTIPNGWLGFLERIERAFPDISDVWLSFYLYRYRYWLEKLTTSELALSSLLRDAELLKITNSEKDTLLLTLKDAAFWISTPSLTAEAYIDWAVQKKKGSLTFWRQELLFCGFKADHFLKFDQYSKEFFSSGSLPKVLVTGNDLIQKGVEPGPLMKTLLEKMYKYQILHKIKNASELIQMFQKEIQG